MHVAIIGQGYVGTAIGKAASTVGHTVFGIESDEARITTLTDIGYPVTSDYSEVINSEIVILAVPTPLDEQREPDLTFITSACKSIKPFLKPGALIINESTSYPGTVREVVAPLLGPNFLYASAPERVDPANKYWDVTNTPRIIGGLTEEALKKTQDFYMTVCTKVIPVSSPEVAEAAKLFENTFRQVNIALVNEFSQIANSMKISTFETLAAAETKPYGFMKFLPSIGVGGHCIPVDPSYLRFKAKEVGLQTQFISLADKINLDMPEFIAERIDKEVGVKGKNIQIAGIAYKPNVPDIRESPAIYFISILRAKGAHVTWHDPYVPQYLSEMSSPIQSADLGIICTAHDNIDYTVWKNSKTRVIDVSSTENTGWPKYL